MAFRLRIDKERCKGCMLCMSVCVKKSLRLSKQINQRGQHYCEHVVEKGCVGCKQCADICPDAAIEIDRVEDDQPGGAGADDAAGPAAD